MGRWKSSDQDREIGARIRAARERIGMTREELARLLAISVQQLGKYERGESQISATLLEAIMSIVGEYPSDQIPQRPATEPQDSTPPHPPQDDGWKRGLQQIRDGLALLEAVAHPAR